MLCEWLTTSHYENFLIMEYRTSDVHRSFGMMQKKENGSEAWQGNRGDYKTRSFMTCTLHQIAVGWSIKEE